MLRDADSKQVLALQYFKARCYMAFHIHMSEAIDLYRKVGQSDMAETCERFLRGRPILANQ